MLLRRCVRFTAAGRYRGIPLTIVSTHMGLPNMDFVVRECRAVVQGQVGCGAGGLASKVALPCVQVGGGRAGVGALFQPCTCLVLHPA